MPEINSSRLVCISLVSAGPLTQPTAVVSLSVRFSQFGGFQSQDCAQVPPEQAVYIDDRAMFVEVACMLGIKCIHHLSHELTRESLAALGLSLED